MKKIFVPLVVIMTVLTLFACSGIERSQKPADGVERASAAGEGPWPLYAITYGKGIILTSPDGEAWTVRRSDTDVPLAAIAYGKETFVVVGARGTIVTGPRDGSAWTIRQSGVTSDLWAVEYAKGLFVAVGSAGTVTTSPDGTTWTKRANLTPYALRNIAFGKDNFVTIGERGSVFNSKDGIYWARIPTQFTDHLLGMDYAQGTFTTVGANGRIMTSSDDGMTWTERYSGTTEYLYAVKHGNGKFVAVGAYGTIVTSPDTRNWTTVRSGSQSRLSAITYARKLFIAVASDGTALESPDGTNWSFSRYAPIPIPEPTAKEEKVVIMRYEPRVEEKVVIIVAEPKAEEKVMVAAAEPKIIILAFEDVHFDFDKSTLKPEAQAILKRNIQMLKDNPKAKVRIAGYTSASGADAYNQELSERRATAVEGYLVNEGIITRDRLSTIGYGKTNPAIYEATPKEIYSPAAKANMRVLFEIIVQ